MFEFPTGTSNEIFTEYKNLLECGFQRIFVRNGFKFYD